MQSSLPVIFIAACVVLSALGDVLFIVKLKQFAHGRALEEAGLPSPLVVSAFTPWGASRYLAFIMFRKYRGFLPPESRLRFLGNMLYVLHWLVVLGGPALAFRYGFSA